jgi:pimeloyl-ACP methyl ester carboxylesterase
VVSGRRTATSGADLRARLLAEIPVIERQLDLAGISTTVLEGGNGPPVILLHEQGEFAAHWMRVIPDLAATNRVIAPDLPGHGTSEVIGGSLDADRVLSWLGELIEHTCASPPVLVGHMLGGAIAARFAVEHGERLNGLVLVDAFGLRWLRPNPGFAIALARYLARPTQRSRDRMLQHCMVDLDRVREQMADRWEPFQTYVIDRMHTPGLKAALPVLMRKLGLRAIPKPDLTRIAVPTTLIWGARDPVTRLRTAETASKRYGWPLHVIEDAGDDPAVEQPEAFLRALRTALSTVTTTTVAKDR